MNEYVKEYMRNEIDSLFIRVFSDVFIEEWHGELWGYLRASYMAGLFNDMEYDFLTDAIIAVKREMLGY